MISRLWLCTSHPWLQLLAAPLHPVTILALMVAAWLAAEPYAFWQCFALRLKRLWQGLLMASVGTFVLIAIPGWVVSKLDANPNAIFFAPATFTSPSLGPPWSRRSFGERAGQLRWRRPAKMLDESAR